MIEFKGFNDWIEIFRGGAQVDSKGQTWDGDKIIESATKLYRPGVHDAPLVVGHPADNAPAFGWVEGLRTTAKHGVKTLEAKFKQVAPEFESLVREGRFRKRSAAFYPDGSLRHVGFLGGMVPAVKGLADVAFQDGLESIEFTEECNNQGGLGMEIKEFFETLKSWAGLTSAFQGVSVPSQWPGQPAAQAANGKSFSEEDIKKAREEASAEARSQAAAEFAEQQAASRKVAREAEIKAQVKALVDGKRVAPAFAEQMTALLIAADNGQEIEFGEGQKGSPATAMMSMLEGLPEGKLFGELATHKAVAAEFAEAEKDWKTGAEIAARVNQKKKEG
jgi:hypothetical protein